MGAFITSSFGPEKRAAFLDHVHIRFVICMIELLDGTDDTFWKGS